MTRAERWKYLDDAFHQALAVSPADRAEMLDDLTRRDALIGAELRNLLAAAAETEPLCVETAVSKGLARFATTRPEMQGRRVGPYLVGELIGEGGMGLVYLARRDDEQFEKTVAIKFLKSSVDSEAALDRFRQERQILANLEHPNIARLLDAGATEEGIPWIAMERVEGVPLPEYCRSQALTITGRVRLFREVCAAVQFAHQQLVVHRDLKPSNILVTPDGTPKLLDFGVAKMLRPNAPTQHTEPGMLPLTPDYASPEQLRGGAASVAGDVYSLGAVLYELLSGARPHALVAYTPEEIVRAICDTPPRLLTQAAPVELRAQLRGDPENITSMALQKDPALRYGSVEQLSADLLRWLERRPVVARPSTFGYRAGKFLRRNTVTTVAFGMLFLALAGGSIVSSLQARRAERRFNQVRELAKTLLFGLHDQLAQIAGTTKARETLVLTARTYLDSLAAEAGGDRGLLLELADSYEKLGDIQNSIQNPNLGESRNSVLSYGKAVALAEQVRAQSPRDSATLRSLAAKYYGLGYQEIQLGQTAAGLAHLEKFHAAMNTAVGLKPAGHAEYRLQAAALNVAGDVLSKRGQIREAAKRYRESLQLAQAWEQAIPGGSGPAAATIARDRIADTEKTLGNLEIAATLYRQCAAERLARATAHPEIVGLQRAVMTTYSSLADVYGEPGFPNLGDHAKALDYLNQAMTIANRLAADPNDARGQSDRAEANLNLATLLEKANPRQSRIHALQALAAFRSLNRKEPGRIYLTTEYAASAILTASLRPASEWRTARSEIVAAAGLLEDARKQDPARTDVAQELMLAHVRQGDVILLSGERDSGHQREARREYEEAVRLADDLQRRSGEDLGILGLACMARLKLAQVLPDEQSKRLHDEIVHAWDGWISTMGGTPWVMERRRQAAAAWVQ